MDSRNYPLLSTDCILDIASALLRVLSMSVLLVLNSFRFSFLCLLNSIRLSLSFFISEISLWIRLNWLYILILPIIATMAVIVINTSVNS